MKRKSRSGYRAAVQGNENFPGSQVQNLTDNLELSFKAKKEKEHEETYDCCRRRCLRIGVCS